jgi:hypothetical protein
VATINNTILPWSYYHIYESIKPTIILKWYYYYVIKYMLKIRKKKNEWI